MDRRLPANAARLSRHERSTTEAHGVTLTPPDLSFLLEATRELTGSLDVEATLATVARLTLPHLGSWCIVDLCDGESMRRLAILHPDPARQALADQLLSGWPPRRDDPLGVPLAVRTRSSEVVLSITEEALSAAAHSPANLVLLRALEIGAYMTIPMLAREHVLGAITYISPNHGDSFTERELTLAEDLASRCAIAIDNARLLEEASRARQAAEHARGAAEHANQVKLRFHSTMSHELRTPLTAIAGYAEILLMKIHGALGALQRQDVSRIQAAERHLLTLVESVLDYAKIDAGRTEYVLQDVMLDAALGEVGDIVGVLSAQKGVPCAGCDGLQDSGVSVHADPDKLRQILVNLVTNAIKFSSAGDVVQVTHRARGGQIEIRVQDYGRGIAPEDCQRIFEPFVQVDGVKSGRYGGTGLGLAISRELAMGMEGGLAVESTLGTGSTFTLTLGRGRDHAA